MTKSATAFRTIGEVSAETGIRQNVLRYWEGLFPALRPLQRAGNRRYYRPEDVALVKRIHRLLEVEGYTVRGIQKLLSDGPAPEPATVPLQGPANALPVEDVRAVRDRLVAALARDDEA